MITPTDVNVTGSMISESSKLFLNHDDTQLIAEIFCEIAKRKSTKAKKVYIALHSIGSPAHYSVVAETYNRIFPDDISSEHSIHGVLSREEQGVVWVGKRGTFALEEWGYKRPTKGLFESVQEIVENIFATTGKPVPFKTIVSEMGKYRQLVNRSSLFLAAAVNPHVQRVSKDHYVPKEVSSDVEIVVTEDGLNKILKGLEEKLSKVLE